MSQYGLTRVPGCEHYSLKYLLGGRIFSYAHQIHGVLAFEPKTVMEIGVGGGMVTAALRSVGIEATTVDVQPELNPDVVASVTELPFEDGSFDVALCCQVLEHLPFDQFGPALSELWRVTRVGAIISLPDVTRSGFVAAKLPKIPPFALNWTLPRLRPRELPQERLDRDGHFWEIGFRGHPHSNIKTALLEAGWTIQSEWRVPELRWHHFYRLEV